MGRLDRHYQGRAILREDTVNIRGVFRNTADVLVHVGVPVTGGLSYACGKSRNPALRTCETPADFGTIVPWCQECAELVFKDRLKGDTNDLPT
jgi:hypothetical protein